MKKILIGLLQTSLSPFIVILGYYLIAVFSVPDGVRIFASVVGGSSICFNFVMGCILIVKGYRDVEVFKG